MTANLNLKLKAPFGKPPAPAPTPTAPVKSLQGATVPISLYREISSDLHSTQADLVALKAKNQELMQCNQQLRLEIERVVQSALHLRHVADSHSTNPALGIALFDEQANLSGAENKAELRSLPQKAIPGKLSPTLGSAPAPTQFVIEQESQPQAASKSEVNAEVSTWWLIAVICLIVLTAFGTGFLLVRPLLPSR